MQKGAKGYTAAMQKDEYPMRINKYLAHQKYCTRRAADELVEKRKVTINGRVAVLGDKVLEGDRVEVNFRPKKYRYYAYNKPRGIITHSAQGNETEIKEVFPIDGVFPVGRLDKDSYGLIILTDDGRLTDALLNPEHEHEKEYRVLCREKLPSYFQRRMEEGIDIEGYMTKPAKVQLLGDKKYSITLTEGKRHQIRRMCDKMGVAIAELERIRIMNVRLGSLKPGAHRAIEGPELIEFLDSVGLNRRN